MSDVAAPVPPRRPPRLRSAAGWLGTATVRIAGAALVISVIEIVRIWSVAPGVLLIVLASGLTVLGALLAGLVLHGLGSGVARIPVVARWRTRVASAGADRLTALVQIAGFAAVIAIVWVVTMMFSTWAHRRFAAAGPAGVLIASVAVVALLAAAALVALLGPLAARALRGRSVLQRWTSGWRGATVGGAGLVGAMVAVVVVLSRAAPAFDYRPAFMAAGFVIALGLGAGLRVERRLRRRGSIAVGAVALLLALASLLLVGGADRTRSALAGRGTTTTAVLRGLWWLADSDGDGFASAFGGGDCDDGDPAVSPAASEVPDNGVDDNCSNGDLDAAALADRVQAIPTRYPGAAKRNVVLITIDTLRADHLGLYGYHRETSPVIDAFGASATVFDRAFSPSPSTRNAVPSLMTSRYPSTLIFRKGSWPPKLVPRAHTMLGSVFKAAGYRTQAVLCCDEMFDKASGVIDGIDAVDDTADKVPNKPADAVARPARDFLARSAGATQPFFLWVHFFDPHDPYVTHPGVESFGKRGGDRYDDEVAYADRHLAWILEAIAAAGHADDTIVAITSDHGEGFGEHGLRHHGNSLYAELVHVPLIVAVPGATPRRIATPVSTIDLGPTLLDLVGIDRPAGQNGRSLAATIIDGAPAPDRTVLSELISIRQQPRSMRAAYYRDWKLLWDLDANTFELFSLADDPLDRNNLIDEHPDVFADMKRRLGEASDYELTLLPGEKKP